MRQGGKDGRNLVGSHVDLMRQIEEDLRMLPKKHSFESRNDSALLKTQDFRRRKEVAIVEKESTRRSVAHLGAGDSIVNVQALSIDSLFEDEKSIGVKTRAAQDESTNPAAKIPSEFSQSLFAFQGKESSKTEFLRQMVTFFEQKRRAPVQSQQKLP